MQSPLLPLALRRQQAQMVRIAPQIIKWLCFTALGIFKSQMLYKLLDWINIYADFAEWGLLCACSLHSRLVSQTCSRIHLDKEHFYPLLAPPRKDLSPFRLGGVSKIFLKFKSLSNCRAVARRALAIDLTYTEQPFSDILGISCWSTIIKQEEQVYNLLDWHLGVLCDLLAAQNSDLTSPIVQSVGDQLKSTASLLFNCSNILGTLSLFWNLPKKNSFFAFCFENT